MSHDVWDWLDFAMTAASLYLSLFPVKTESRRRTRRVDRFRSLRVWGVEWTAHDREDDDQS